MIELTATTMITADCRHLWEYLVDVERWWLRSNPDHLALEILPPATVLGPGTRIRIRERIAGIVGDAVGTITDFVPYERVTWKAEKARYRFLGITILVEEGVTWWLKESNEATELSAKVWAEFPTSLKGRVAQWVFLRPLHGVWRNFQNVVQEFVFIKSEVEAISSTSEISSGPELARGPGFK